MGIVGEDDLPRFGNGGDAGCVVGSATCNQYQLIDPFVQVELCVHTAGTPDFTRNLRVEIGSKFDRRVLFGPVPVLSVLVCAQP